MQKNSSAVRREEKNVFLLNDDPIIASMERTGYAPWMEEDDAEHDDYWSDFEPFAIYEG